ncbi:PPOX class F420-dependent oxidoreductase [Streptomyces sp. AN091965]|uniref:PPOX class F420-dependent oxidoreductase n=1 Tax=Streptomyces sp. AN091965 TaxID=2927803 RepID=UPI001F617C0B|nr:PPOX class F420-dependent oxidoreductase [Streptomyces sp. AN091965]MCI3931398.1 PPOX class F420-dependent oxidoreductase [Streptomyces sp. AN091965]
MKPNPARPASPELARFEKQQAVLLTSHKKDGTGVGTPVHFAVDGDHAYFRTFGKAGKVKRLRRDPRVEIAPSTLRGKPTGPGITARARRLERGTGEDARASRLIARKYPVQQGVLVPLWHKLRRDATLHYEIRPVTSPGAGPAERAPDQGPGETPPAP